MWVYGVSGKNFHAGEVYSAEDLGKLVENFDWFWVDCADPSSRDVEAVSRLTGVDPKTFEDLKSWKIFQRPRNFGGYTFISISYAAVQENGLRTYPIHIVVGRKMLLTMRSKESSALIEYVVQTLKESLPGDESLNPSFVLCELLRENTTRVLDVVLALREAIEKLEEKAIAKPSKSMINEVFIFRKKIAALYRLLWNQQQIIGGLKNGLVSNVRLCERSILGLEDAMNSISRELEFLTSYDNSLDGVLRLQDLSMIHRVERTLVYLTVITVIMNLFLILLEMGIFKG